MRYFEDKNRIAVIVQEKDDWEFIKSKLEPYQKQYRLKRYVSVSDFRMDGMVEGYSGMIIDFKTAIKASGMEKRFVYQFEDLIPLMKIRRTPKSDGISGTFRGDNFVDQELLDVFFDDSAVRSNSRRLRRYTRRNVFLNIQCTMISKNGDRREIRTCTSDASEGGLFIIDLDANENDHEVEIVINDIHNHSPILARMRWHLSWGKTMSHLPGYGVEFLVIDPEQVSEIKGISI